MAIDSKRFSDKALEDFKLVDEAKEGDQKAYAELLHRYRKSVYHMILKMVRNIDDAEDLTIEAFGKAFKNIHKFNPDFTFSTWLFRIATNNSIDFIRKKRLNTTSISSAYIDKDGDFVAINIQDSKLDPQEEAIKNEKIEIMQNFVTQLPPKYRHLVRMRYFDELSYEEIAQELEAPLGTVKAQLHRARELLYGYVRHHKDSI